MKNNSTRNTSDSTDFPYDPDDAEATLAFWKNPIVHTGLEELRAKRGRPPMKPEDRKEQVALRIDRDILKWFRAQGTGWQTRVNDALREFKDKN